MNLHSRLTGNNLLASDCLFSFMLLAAPAFSFLPINAYDFPLSKSIGSSRLEFPGDVESVLLAGFGVNIKSLVRNFI